MNICIIGLGLLGGSFGLAVKNLEEKHRVIGVDINPDHQKKALELGLVDEVQSIEKCVPVSDLIILATPVDTIANQVTEVLEMMNDEAVLTDFGSTKELICKNADSHPRRSRFIGGHPIAGTEDSGPAAAFSGLLKEKMMILCDTETSDDEAVNRLVELYSKLQLKVHFMPSASHDLHIAFVSHLSHISSFALGSSVLEKEKDEKNIFIMAGSGFSSTVRLAKSSPDMWAPIFRQNNKNVSDSLKLYIDKLTYLKDLIDQGKYEELHKFMEETNDIRRILKGD